MIRVLLSRALDLAFRRRRDARLTEEIQSHLDLLTSEYVAHGMTAADARAAALRAFGGVEQMKEVYRDQRGVPFADTLLQDVRFAFRLLRRDRAFTVTAVLVLGIGIGVNNMLFTIVNAHTIRGLPIDGADRVVYVSSFDDRTPDRGVSYPDFDDIRSGTQSLVRLAAFNSAPVVIAGDSHAAERLEGAFVSEEAFDVLGIEPVFGRGFSIDEQRPGASAVAIFGAVASELRYGTRGGALGRSILVNGAPAVVVGILPDRSGFPSTADVWLPLVHTPGFAGEKRDARTLRVFGRVRDGVTIAAAGTALESIAERLSRDHPETNRNVRARVVPINERFLGRLTDPAWRAFMAVGFLVVLISSANVANLMLASAMCRAREIAIRGSLGASRRRVLRQLLTEGLILASIGGLTGLALATAGLRLFRSAIPQNVLPYWFDYSLDARVVLALVAVSMGTVLVFALLPAVRASRTDVTGVLKEGGPAGTLARSTQRLTTAFLAAEFGLAVVLLAHLTMGLRNERPDLPTDNVLVSTRILTAEITLPRDTYGSPEQRTLFFQRLNERLRQHTAVSSSSLASAAPLQNAPEQPIDIEGRSVVTPESATRVRTVSVAPRYFETLGLTLIRGGDFSEDDGTAGRAHAIVNERLAREFFEGQDAIGQRLAVAPAAGAEARRWLTIVGIAPDIRQRPVPNTEPILYLPLRGSPSASATLLVRSRGEGSDLAPLLRQELQALDANIPVNRVRTMAQASRDSQWNGRLSARLILALTIISVGLATAGLYAVTAYGVSQRTHEIGLRVALGARTPHVAVLIARRVAVQLAVGLMAGIVCTMLWDRTFSGGPGVRITDPRSLTLVALVLVVLAAVACWAPIRRAVRLNPLNAIRATPNA
jgi:predicted permease